MEDQVIYSKTNLSAVIYARVSTNDQSYQSQIAELKGHAAANGYKLLAIFKEKISGNNKITERPELIKLMELVKGNRVDYVLVTELSSLGTGSADTLTIIEQLTAESCCL